MRRGKRQDRRPRARGAGLLLSVLALAWAPGRNAPQTWWEVRLELTVRGGYAVRGPAQSCSGEFECRARWEGTLQRDGDDFLLFHARADVPSWRIRETPDPPDAGEVLTEFDAPGKPRLRLNYVIRQDDEVRFSFVLEGIDVPLRDSQGKFPLVMPRSKDPSAGEEEYGKCISDGDNLIAVDDKGLEQKSLEKSFSWDWTRRRWTAREAGAVLVTGSHRADVTVTFLRHD